MLTDDYLMRMIRLATAALAQALGLKAVTLYQDALMVLDRALEQILGLPAQILHRMDDQGIISLCTTSEGINLDQVNIVAQLFQAEGEIYESVKDPAESSWRFLRALNLYLELFLNEDLTSSPEPDERIDFLVARFPQGSLPTDIQYPLFYYYEKCRAFSSAIQVLDSLIRLNPDSAELRAEQSDFFQRLAQKTEEELSQGGITREYVTQRLRGFSPGSNGTDVSL
jgi:tetratricopeptide (TPR) repeat protein